MKIKNNFTKYAECIFPYKLNINSNKLKSLQGIGAISIIE